MRVVHPLEPIFSARSRVLILGTMPSPKSRECRFYYAHPQNRFWRVLAAVFETPVPGSNEDRHQFILSHDLALWDVLHSCEIEGASDASIKNPVANDLSLILAHAPIQTIFCTGMRSAALYKRLIEPQTQRPAIVLPSTSPANCAVPFAKLFEAYAQIRACL